ncbi:MAG: hypothetical protein JJU29_08930 [Verrucomicrobia bacterium]|nr:hypothetical protein [Verrucomicrobiota bacterium]MCH8511394.1 hypothetical protein [Kiritimatiellia bacterium]
MQTYFPEQQFIQLVSSTDFPHYASVSVLVVEKTHLFTLLRNDDQVASFLHAQMPAPTQADQVRDFLELFAELRGYEIVAEKPEAQDTRIGEGRRAVPDAGRFDLEIGEDPHVWQIKASLRTDPTYSGSIYRYTFSLPRTDRRNLRVNRGELQFIEHLIR